MGKARMYGMQTRYVPNAKADMRHRKKVYQRGRETVDERRDRREKEGTK